MFESKVWNNFKFFLEIIRQYFMQNALLCLNKWLKWLALLRVQNPSSENIKRAKESKRFTLFCLRWGNQIF